MNKKKKILLTVCFILVLLGSFITYNSLHKPTKQELKKDTLLAIYIQDETSETGYTLSSDTNFPTEGFILNLEKSSCTNEGTLTQNSETKKISLSTVSNNSCSLYFDKEPLTGIDGTLAKIGKNILTEGPSFVATATTDETKDGLFSLEDDYGTSYYYRGAVTDNYVQFGNWAGDESVDVSLRGKSMYWRIIRVNGDGSVRMIYDGTQAYANGTNNTDRLALINVAWNTTNFKDAKYVGYMYGGTNGIASTKRVNLGETGYADSGNAIYNETDTNIKNQIEAWYNHNLSELDAYVEDVIYCNDRSISETSKEWWKDEGTERGYGTNVTAYGAFPRVSTATGSFNTEHTPNLKCKDKNDSFTKLESDRGNGKLKEKVGLITLDEMVIAGAYKNTANKSYYLYKGAWYWSLSPRNVYNGYANMFSGINADGYINYGGANNAGGVAPVISLTPEYFMTLIGDGTKDNPYREAE